MESRHWPLFPVPVRTSPGSERLGLQGDRGGRWWAEAEVEVEVEAGARLEIQGTSIQAGEVDSQEAKECEEQHGNSPLAGSRGGAQWPGMEDNHFIPGQGHTASEPPGSPARLPCDCRQVSLSLSAIL